MSKLLTAGFAGFVLTLSLVAISGFGHYEPECVAEASPEPVMVNVTPTVIPFDFSKELIVDGQVRCYALNPRGAMPAISCVVVP